MTFTPARQGAIAVAAPVLALVGLVLAPAGQVRANPDISDYDGNACAAGQFYNATSGACELDAVASEPGAPMDVSDFDGTACTGRQFYNASAGECDVASVIGTSGAPMDLAGLATDIVSISDPGARCASTEFYSVAHAMCWPDTITSGSDS